MAEKLAPGKSHTFIHNGQKVFDWDQTVEEVNMFIFLPDNVPKKLFNCKIDSKHIEVGIKGNQPYLNRDLTCPGKTDCSFWTLEDDIMHITLQKRDKGQTWSSPIMGEGQLDPYATDLEQKRSCFNGFKRRIRGSISLRPSSREVAPTRGPSWVGCALLESFWFCERPKNRYHILLF